MRIQSVFDLKARGWQHTGIVLAGDVNDIADYCVDGAVEAVVVGGGKTKHDKSEYWIPFARLSCKYAHRKMARLALSNVFASSESGVTFNRAGTLNRLPLILSRERWTMQSDL